MIGIIASSRRRSSGGGGPALGESVALSATGPGIALTLADGVYTVTTDASSEAHGSYIGSADGALAGDYVAEFEIVSHANGMWAGFDNAAPAWRSYANIDECFFPDAGFGAGRANYVKNGSFEVQNVAFGPKLYMERVGTAVKFYQGTDWATASASAPIVTSAAFDGGARSFQLGVNSAGLAAQWKVRVVAHP